MVCKHLYSTAASFEMNSVLLETSAKHNGALFVDLPITEKGSLDNWQINGISKDAVVIMATQWLHLQTSTT